jgi:LPS sulfotransferase NodH
MPVNLSRERYSRPSAGYPIGRAPGECFNRAMAASSRPGPEPIDSYLICATPRTGSTLLCGLLESAGVAGRPESYFRRQGEQEWAARWGILSPEDGSFGYASYVQAAVTAGSTANGVFAVRIMWETLGEMVAKLADIYPGFTGPDADLLSEAFGRTRFVYLWRDDVVAQAVSLLRAEQTNVWHDTAGDRPEPEQAPRFDFGQIQERVREIEAHNTAWRDWFASAGIRPHRVRYEELAAEPVRIARDVLGFLGLDLPGRREMAVRHRRLADELNAQWLDNYNVLCR